MCLTMVEIQKSKNEMTDLIHILSRLLASIMRDVQSLPLRLIMRPSIPKMEKSEFTPRKHANGRTELIGVEIKGTQTDQSYFHLFFDQ